MAITAVATAQGFTHRVPVSFSLGSTVTALEVSNRSAFALTVWLSMGQVGTVAPNGHVVFTNVVTGGVAINLLVIPLQSSSSFVALAPLAGANGLGVADITSYASGDPLPATGTYEAVSLSAIDTSISPSLGHELVGGNTPTLGTLKANVSSQTISARSNDARGIITLVYTATPPAGGSTVCDILFSVSYNVTPFVIVGSSLGSYNITNLTATGFSLIVQATPGVSASHVITYQAVL